jgi:hypothetical protein
MRALWARVVVGVAILFAAPVIGYAQSITAMWDPNPPADLVLNYEVCVGTTSLSCNFRNATVAATQTSYTFLPNPGVLYRVAVRAVSAFGAGSYSPEVLVSVPALGTLSNRTSTVNGAISPITISATDPDGSSLTFSHTGLPFGLTLNQSTGVITGTPTTTGTYNVTIFVTDGLATASAAFVWTVQTASSDTTAPTLAITSHTNGQSVTTSSITLSGTATDSGAGGSGITSVTVNGTAATGGTASGNNTANWSRSVSLVSGANVLTVVATDGAGNSRTSSITVNRTSTDTTAPTLSITSHTSGQVVTTSSITLRGTATDSGRGGSGITSVTVNGSAATGGTVSGSNTANWSRTLTLTGGSNTINVVATDGAGNARTLTITIVYTAPLSLTLTSNLLSPQVAGTPITFTAGASGGGATPYQFKWWLFDGTTWTMLRDWGTATAYTWTPTTANANYRVGIWARDATSTADSNTFNLSIPYVINVASSGSLTVGLTSNVPSPQVAGTAVTFTASASGGSGSYQFKWWVWNGTVWTMVGDWATSTTFTWTPTEANANYRIGVWARNASSTADSNQFNLSVPFVINPVQTPGLLILGVTSSVQSPQPVGAPITFTATATGGSGSYQFKWWLWDGATWTIVRDWGVATFTWTPTVASANYRVGIWAREASSTADSNQFNLSIPFTVSNSTGTLTLGLTTSIPTPVRAGTAITFTPTAVGGSGSYQFKWWLWDGMTWTMVRDWSTGTFSWTPPTANSNYRVGVWGREASSTADSNQFNLSIPVPAIP